MIQTFRFFNIFKQFLLTGEEITVKFLDFDVEKSTNCTFDYLEMREGIDETGKLIGRLCGTGEAGSLVSTISLWLRFKSDTSITERGFLATYTKTGYTFGVLITIKDH